MRQDTFIVCLLKRKYFEKFNVLDLLSHRHIYNKIIVDMKYKKKINMKSISRFIQTLYRYSRSALVAFALIMFATSCAIKPQEINKIEITDLVTLNSEWTKMNESPEKQAGRDLFRENKYGMFIHWGLYAIPGGIWKGQTMEENGVGHNIGEWIMRNKEIPRAEYSLLANQFNPVNFDADEWVAIAKAAGMNYIVITSKHHDGFALFDSKVSDYNVVDATPFGRDIIRELEIATKKAGLSFGVYYSHAVDWQDGGDAGYKDYVTSPPTRWLMANTWDPSPQSFDDYIKNKSSLLKS